MPDVLAIKEFLEQAKLLAVVDVRAPIEHNKGRIPGSINLPLFSDEERAIVGTKYRQEGRQRALLQGLELAGPKMHLMAKRGIEIARESNKGSRDRRILVHCWRGGMRSQSMAWLFEQADLEVGLLDGGYKNFRRHAQSSFQNPLNLVVLSGLTGAGKTRQLMKLKEQGEQIVDLEGLANHRGSALGGIGQGGQPSVEQFENVLFTEFSRLDLTKRIWVEDESRRIGAVSIPEALFRQIRAAPAVFMEVCPDTRLKLAVEDYGTLPASDIVSAIERITKRLGGQNAKAAIEAINGGNVGDCAEILLAYYDRTYNTAKDRNPRETTISVSVDDPESENAAHQIICAAESLVANA